MFRFESIFQICFLCFVIIHAMAMIVLSNQSGCNVWISFFSADSKVNQSDTDFSYIRDGEFKLRYEEMESNFKVFVYPKKYFHTPSEFTGPYASEAFFFKNLEESRLRTDNAEDANMFFIPISVQDMSSKGITLYKMRNYTTRCIQTISSEFPYWNRSFGLDHFFVSCHELGLKVTQAVPLLVKNAIRVVCSPKNNEGYVKGKDLTLPQVLLPFIDQAPRTNTRMRTRLALLAGMSNQKVDRDYFNIINSTPLKGAKENALWTQYYYTTKFCMCPGGSPVDNARIADAIHYGCVPVIWPDHYDLPFSELLWWNLFSRKIEKYDVYYLNRFLKKISDAEYRALQNFTEKVQMHFQWNSPPTQYDAFHFIMLQLFERYQKRSHVLQLTKELAKYQTTGPLEVSNQDFETDAAIVTMGEEDSEIQKHTLERAETFSSDLETIFPPHLDQIEMHEEPNIDNDTGSQLPLMA